MFEDFKVKTEDFEGPLEVLLELIEKRKLHISTVSLSKVADDFIEFTNSLEEKDGNYISNLSDFILVASTLLLIKSKSLLPTLDLSEEEVENIDDLEKRLLEYKKFKELSLEISKMFGNFLYFPQERKKINVVFAPTKEINLVTLKESLQNALNNIPIKETKLAEITVKKIVSLEDMIDKLSERIQTSMKTSFKNFAKTTTGENDSSKVGKGGLYEIPKEERINVIVSFLAMLELVKQGIIRVNQESEFDDIEMENDRAGVPVY
jgi:segregation and condensation protein A